MHKVLLCAILMLASGTSFAQKKVYFARSNYTDSVAMEKNIPALATELVGLYKDATELTYLDNLFRLQLVAGLHPSSATSLKKIHLLSLGDSVTPTALGFPYQLYNACMLENPSPDGFTGVYNAVFQKTYMPLNEDGKNWAAEYFSPDMDQYKQTLLSRIHELNISDSLLITDAVRLCRAYCTYMVFKKTSPLAKQIFAAIEKEKYIRNDSVLIKMPDGGTIALTVVRDKKVNTPQPVVLMYNIYAGSDAARCKNALARGYIGIVANTRGKRLSPDVIEPFEHDAKDAYYIIDWISKQAWCNGKVGMYGGSYLGFSQWGAAKFMHPALKTIVPQVSVGAGIDYPMHNGVFMNYMLQWIHFVTDNKLVDLAGFNDEKKWNQVFGDWYTKGASFRSLDSIEGRPNNIFQRWLQHPAYDSYWQNMTPQKEEFAKINIPIFTTTGYWDDDQTGAMYYYRQYFKWNKNPNYYLLIGPYDHGGSQGFPKPLLNGYTIDSVANIPILDIVFKWFDYVMKDSSRPALLKDKVNFEVMGANEWKHVASLSKMSNDTLHFYLAGTAKTGFSLLAKQPAKQTFIYQQVDFKDRGEALFSGQNTAMGAYPMLVDSMLKPEKEKMIFVSAPVDKPVIISGAVEAAIVASINKKDMDIVLDLFEQTPDGKYFALNQNIQRASYTYETVQRKLLQPGKIETIWLKNTYITCRQLQKGSRIIVVLGVNKNPNWQINYGTGKDVSGETMKDAAIPAQIKWYSNSCIKIPVLR